ncbi:MAG: hypothetical protein Q9190_003592 [Brigantiaea leucoxantha]
MTPPTSPQSNHSSTEHSPLLGTDPQPRKQSDLNHSQRRVQRHVLGLVMVALVLVNFSFNVTEAAWVRLYESVICHSFYAIADPSVIGKDGKIAERLCKIGPVQEELALLQGWQTFVNTLPGLFLAIPYGMLADRFGRKPFLLLGTVSLFFRFLWIAIVCAFPRIFPIRWILFQGLTSIFGGGTIVTSALVFVMVSDVTLPDQRVNFYFVLQALEFATSIISPPFGSVLMERNIWIPIILGTSTLVFICFLILTVSETLGALGAHADPPLPADKTGTPLTGSGHRFLSPSPPSTPSPSSSSSASTSPPTRPHTSTTKPLSLLSRLTKSFPLLSFLFADLRILFLLFSLLPFAFGETANELFLQYISARYNIPLSRCAYFFSLRAGISVLVLTLVLPYLAVFLIHRFHYNTLSKDIVLARLSFSITAIGTMIQALASSISVFTIGLMVAALGVGVAALVKCLLARLVHENELARTFTVMGLVQTVGILVAAPVEAELLQAGLRQGGPWVGLPFGVAGALFTATAGGMWVLRIKEETKRPATSRRPGMDEEEDMETDR